MMLVLHIWYWQLKLKLTTTWPASRQTLLYWELFQGSLQHFESTMQHCPAVQPRQFYESALTDHKNAFLFITKTHEKVHKNEWRKSTKTHRFKNRRCGSLAVIVTTTVHHGSSCHKHQTWAPQLWNSNSTDTISALLKVRRVRKSWLTATWYSRGNIYTQSFWMLTNGATVKFFRLM